MKSLVAQDALPQATRKVQMRTFANFKIAWQFRQKKKPPEGGFEKSPEGRRWIWLKFAFCRQSFVLCEL